MSKLGIDQFRSFFVWYKGLPHQDLAIAELWKKMPVSLLEDDADWVQTYRDPAIEEDPEVSVVLTGKENENSWGGVKAAAKIAGAKYPEVVAAQWALESAWGEHTSGEFNYFGIKATGDEPYSTCTTWEHYDGKDVTIQAKFRDFDSLQDCIDDLVTKWYKDYKGYKGVNRAQSVGECCQLLRQEGYATDPHYSSKLMSIINRQAG
jgi:flagellum-specific peptidoglycan hydrolase FlgJ